MRSSFAACALALLGLACRPVSASASDDAPAFSLDAVSPEVMVPIRGDPGFLLVGQLASKGGMRRLLLRGGGMEQEIAPAGWNLPACGARSDAGADLGAMAICWNALTGGEAGSDRMPPPANGLALRCRYRSADGSLTPPLEVGFEVPTWLRDVAVDSDRGFAVEMLRDASGTLFGRATRGDGLYRAALSEGVASAPALVQAREPGQP